MPPVTDEQMEALKPYIAGAKPDERGETEMLCPMHPDSRRSASFNAERGVWYCHAGCGGGSVRQLVESKDAWVPLEDRGHIRRISHRSAPVDPAPKPTLADVKRWHRRFMRDRDLRNELFEVRGITAATARKARIGHDGRHYKIPVFNPERELWNVRTYDMHVKGDRRKIWSVKGWGSPRLYPVGVLERALPGSAILWCEGEWDTLLALQSGYQAVTRTGSAKSWQPEWDIYFDGKRVFLCHDRDYMGVAGNGIVGAALQGVAAEVKVCELPFPITEKHGKDLTDYILQSNDQSLAVGQLMKGATTWKNE